MTKPKRNGTRKNRGGARGGYRGRGQGQGRGRGGGRAGSGYGASTVNHGYDELFNFSSKELLDLDMDDTVFLPPRHKNKENKKKGNSSLKKQNVHTSNGTVTNNNEKKLPNNDKMRKKKSMFDEARETSSRSAFDKTLRNKPIDFIKSSEVYDPSAMVKNLLAENNRLPKDPSQEPIINPLQNTDEDILMENEATMNQRSKELLNLLKGEEDNICITPRENKELFFESSKPVTSLPIEEILENFSNHDTENEETTQNSEIKEVEINFNNLNTNPNQATSAESNALETKLLKEELELELEMKSIEAEIQVEVKTPVLDDLTTTINRDLIEQENIKLEYELHSKPEIDISSTSFNDEDFFFDRAGDESISKSLKSSSTTEYQIGSHSEIKRTTIKNTSDEPGTLIENTRYSSNHFTSCTEYDPTFKIGGAIINTNPKYNSRNQRDSFISLATSSKSQSKSKQKFKKTKKQYIDLSTNDDEGQQAEADELYKDYIGSLTGSELPEAGENSINSNNMSEKSKQQFGSEELSSMKKLSLFELGDKDEDIEINVPFTKLEEDYKVDFNGFEIERLRRDGFGNTEFLILLLENNLDNNDNIGEPQWINLDEMKQILCNRGMKKNRISAYIQFVHDQFIGKEDEPDYYDDDLVFSDSEFEDDLNADDDDSSDNDDDDDDDEGLDIEMLTQARQAFALRELDNSINDYLDTCLPQTVNGKGKNKAFPNLDIDDESLRQTMESKWDKRQKRKTEKRNLKQLRKKELRAENNDLSEAYPHNMHRTHIKNEISHLFYNQSNKCIKFTPLIPIGRKIVKAFADAYNLETRKINNGPNTTLVVFTTKKTSNSAEPDYEYIRQLENQKPKIIAVEKSRGKQTERNIMSTISKMNLQEGDIVGKDAPEIAQNNIGRRMLEKLGWNPGLGLGISGNQGIALPIVAKVKKTRLGIRVN